LASSVAYRIREERSEDGEETADAEVRQRETGDSQLLLATHRQKPGAGRATSVATSPGRGRCRPTLGRGVGGGGGGGGLGVGLGERER